MKSEDYTQGDAFQAERRGIFSAQWLPVCAAGQLANPGDFLSLTVGGAGIVAVRDTAGTVRVLRNACRHQNMPVVAQPAGYAESFRCRFHGWTYGLDGKFAGAPPPVAPPDPACGKHDLQSLAVEASGAMVFFRLGEGDAPTSLGPLPAYGGTIALEVACNWKVLVEHLLGAQRDGSTDFTWHWPLLALRRAGTLAIIEQIVPATFLRTKLMTHVFGATAEEHRQAAQAIKHVCEQSQKDRAGGAMAQSDGALMVAFHRRLADVYAGQGAAR